jgi:hypothetical protein
LTFLTGLKEARSARLNPDCGTFSILSSESLNAKSGLRSMKKEEVLDDIRNPKWYNLMSNLSRLIPPPTR